MEENEKLEALMADYIADPAISAFLNEARAVHPDMDYRLGSDFVNEVVLISQGKDIGHLARGHNNCQLNKEATYQRAPTQEELELMQLDGGGYSASFEASAFEMFKISPNSAARHILLRFDIDEIDGHRRIDVKLDNQRRVVSMKYHVM